MCVIVSLPSARSHKLIYSTGTHCGLLPPSARLPARPSPPARPPARPSARPCVCMRRPRAASLRVLFRPENMLQAYSPPSSEATSTRRSLRVDWDVFLPFCLAAAALLLLATWLCRTAAASLCRPRTTTTTPTTTSTATPSVHRASAAAAAAAMGGAGKAVHAQEGATARGRAVPKLSSPEALLLDILPLPPSFFLVLAFVGMCLPVLGLVRAPSISLCYHSTRTVRSYWCAPPRVLMPVRQLASAVVV